MNTRSNITQGRDDPEHDRAIDAEFPGFNDALDALAAHDRSLPAAGFEDRLALATRPVTSATASDLASRRTSPHHTPRSNWASPLRLAAAIALTASVGLVYLATRPTIQNGGSDPSDPRNSSVAFVDTRVESVEDDVKSWLLAIDLGQDSAADEIGRLALDSESLESSLNDDDGSLFEDGDAL
jgi:hypothetical protein